MAHTPKDAERIFGPGGEPENTLVQKSNPLFSLWRSDMTLPEFKILDTYLARINSYEPERRTVVFTKGELEGLLGVTKINQKDLAQRLNGLGRFVEIHHSNKVVHKVALFEEAYAVMGEDGLWTVNLTCTPKAMQYIFNVDKIGYLRYKLRSITCLKSRYSYILFLYLEKNRSMHLTWEENIDKLKIMLGCEKDPLYSENKFFNQRILKRAQKELCEKTECQFKYETVKRGKNIVAIRFTLESIAAVPVPPVDDGQLTMFGDGRDEIDALAAVLPAGFSRDQVRAICLAATPVAASLYGVAEPTPAQIMGYLQNKMGMLMAYDAKERIPHKDRYLLTMIENDLARYSNKLKAKHAERKLDGDETLAIQRLLAEEPATVGTDPELAARAAELQKQLR